MKRILFVDDEQPLLDGLRMRLRRMKSKWDMVFVDSGAQALELMTEQPVDVVVSDMRMPGMDGAALLEQVSRRSPQTIRIVLSGFADLEHTLRLVPFAHQYLSKPCEAQQLENVVDRCLLLHEVLNQPRLRKLVGGIRKLPALPRAYSQLQQIVSDEKMTVGDVAHIVSADPALTARLLQLVNSAFFRLAKRISNVEQAVGYLGFRAIRNLALSIELFSSWVPKNTGGIELETLQAHCQSIAAIARALAGKAPIADDAMLAGLLHDIGYWILAQECPEDLSQAATLAATEQIPLYAAETRVIGASHAEIGAYLLGLWGLPPSVVEAVAHHHQPERVTHTSFDVMAALVTAHSLSPVDDSKAFPLELPPDPKVDPAYLMAVHAPFDWNEAVQRAQIILSETVPS